MSHIPVDIDDGENIVRFILTPWHIKGGSKTVKRQAFKPKAGNDELSVIRHTYMGSDFCKQKGKAFAVALPKESYCGLANISPIGIKECGSNVFDSREEFLGHAHISHGIFAQNDQPLTSQENERLDQKLNCMISKAAYYADPNPEADDWQGDVF